MHYIRVCSVRDANFPHDVIVRFCRETFAIFKRTQNICLLTNCLLTGYNKESRSGEGWSKFMIGFCILAVIAAIIMIIIGNNHLIIMIIIGIIILIIMIIIGIIISIHYNHRNNHFNHHDYPRNNHRYI